MEEGEIWKKHVKLAWVSNWQEKSNSPKNDDDEKLQVTKLNTPTPTPKKKTHTKTKSNYKLEAEYQKQKPKKKQAYKAERCVSCIAITLRD